MAGQNVQANLINERGDNSKKTDLKSEDEILDKIAKTPTEIELKDDKGTFLKHDIGSQSSYLLNL